jgi:hypothetical protein
VPATLGRYDGHVHFTTYLSRLFHSARSGCDPAPPSRLLSAGRLCRARYLWTRHNSCTSLLRVAACFGLALINCARLAICHCLGHTGMAVPT